MGRVARENLILQLYDSDAPSESGKGASLSVQQIASRRVSIPKFLLRHLPADRYVQLALEILSRRSVVLFVSEHARSRYVQIVARQLGAGLREVELALGVVSEHSRIDPQGRAIPSARLLDLAGVGSKAVVIPVGAWLEILSPATAEEIFRRVVPVITAPEEVKEGTSLDDEEHPFNLIFGDAPERE